MCQVELCGCMEFCSTLLKFGYCRKVIYNDEACDPCSENEPA